MSCNITISILRCAASTELVFKVEGIDAEMAKQRKERNQPGSPRISPGLLLKEDRKVKHTVSIPMSTITIYSFNCQIEESALDITYQI
jgi:hypothetical protein